LDARFAARQEWTIKEVILQMPAKKKAAKKKAAKKGGKKKK
jgi:hypothetical protein